MAVVQHTQTCASLYFLQHLHDLKRKAHRDKDTACHDGPSAVKHPKYMQCCQGKELATLLRSRLVSLWPCLHPNHLKNCAFGNFLSVKLGLKTLVRVVASVKCLRNRSGAFRCHPNSRAGESCKDCLFCIIRRVACLQRSRFASTTHSRHRMHAAHDETQLITIC